MAERPILMSARMVRAILAGTKRQTRRVVKPQPPHDPQHDHVDAVGSLHRWWAGRLTLGKQHEARCPFGQPGDLLWCRETWARDDEDGCLMYRADLGRDANADAWEQGRIEGVPRYRWRPSIHMPRWASRITLRVTDVRVERLGDISEADAVAEGIERRGPGWAWYTDAKAYTTDPRTSYRDLWESINGPGSWDANPWVWCLTFERVEGGNG